MAEITIPASSITKHVMLNVRLIGRRTWVVRQWCAVRLIMIAAWILGTGLFIDVAQRSVVELNDAW